VSPALDKKALCSRKKEPASGRDEGIGRGGKGWAGAVEELAFPIKKNAGGWSSSQ